MNQWVALVVGTKARSIRENIQCPRIVLAYNKSMGGVDLADMLLSLYRINVKTKRWYIKVFWHLIDICKVNAWNLYRRHHVQNGFSDDKLLSLRLFSCDLANSLVHANKPAQNNQRGRPSKRHSIELATSNPKSSKKASVPTPCDAIRYDEIGHWPEAVEKRERCRFCQAHTRTKCTKCKLALCLIQERNCFKNFHVK